MLAGAATGYRAGRLRVEAEYLYRDSPYDQTSPILGASGKTSERIAGEIAQARERVYSLTSHHWGTRTVVYADERREQRP